MNFSLWNRWTNWFRTRKSLVNRVTHLEDSLKYAAGLLQAQNQTLRYSLVQAQNEADALRNDGVALLGAVALQHQGDYLVKDEFMEMLLSPDSKLEVAIERDDDSKGTSIKVHEREAEQHVEEDEQ